MTPWQCLVTGKALDSPAKGNVDKMSEKCRKNVRKISKNCPEGRKHNFSDIFWTIFAQFLPIWSMLLFGDPVQRAPVTSNAPVTTALS